MKYTFPRFESRSSRTFVANLLAFLLLASQFAPLASAQTARNATRQQQPEKVKGAQPGKAEGGNGSEKSGTGAIVPAAASITATKTDNIPQDTQVAPGSTINYTVTVTNNGTETVNGLSFNDTPDANTTLVPNSISTQPVANPDAYNVIGNVAIAPNAAQGLLANDCDPDNGATCSSTGLTASGPTTGPTNGQVTINSNGSFTYNPNPGYSGTDSFTYTVTDAGADNTAGNADDKTDTTTATLTVSTPIWFVKSGAGAGDGRIDTPFNCYTGTSVQGVTTCFSDTAADEAGDSIFLYDGSYTGGYALLADQKLIGQGASASLAALHNNVTVEPYSKPLPATDGSPAEVVITTTLPATHAVPVSAGGITLRGFTVSTTTGAKIFGSAFGTLTVGSNASPDVALNGAGQAINLTNGTLADTSGFQSVATTSSTAQGIFLSQVADSGTGTVTFGSTTVSGSVTQGILFQQSTADINFGNTAVGTATPLSGGTDAISLQNNESGTRTFGSITTQNNSAVGFLHGAGGGPVSVTGTTTITNPGGIGIDVQSSNANLSFAATTVNKGATAGTGVRLINNTSRTISFSSLAITASNGTGLLANTGGAINTGGGSIGATGGPSLDLGGVALGLNFTSLSSTNSGTFGIYLNATSGAITATTTTITNPSGAGMSIAGATGGPYNFNNTSVTGSGNTGVDLGTNSAAITFANLNINPDSNQRAFHSVNSTGTITTTSGNVQATGNVTLEISGASAGARTPISMTLTNLDSTNSAGNGVDLNFVSGNLTVNDPGVATNIINAGNGTSNTGVGIRVQNTGAGAISFGGTSVTGSGSTGVFLNNNQSAVAFTNLDISPDANQRGLHATDNDANTAAGSITVTSGTISTTNGSAGGNNVAIEIVGAGVATLERTPINLTFNTVSANNAQNGIVLNNTSDGGNAFRTLGAGSTDGSGGVITNITNRGASFVNADDIILNNMTFTNVGTQNGGDPLTPTSDCGGLQSGTNTGCNAGIHANNVTGLTLANVDLTTGAQQGVNGNNVTNFVFSNSNVSGFGNSTNEVGVRFNNLLGVSSMSNVHVFNNFSFQVEIQNESGTLSSFNVTNCEFNHGGTASTNGVDGLLFSAQGTAVMNTVINTSNFHDLGSGGFFSDSAGTATTNVTITNSTFQRFGSIGITVAKAGGSNVKFNITGNTVRDNGQAASGAGHAININKASPSTNGTTLQGVIANNTIGESTDTADTDDKGSAIRVVGIGQGALIATLHNNNIQDFGERGILATMQEDTSGNNSMSLNITNNTVNNPGPPTPEHAILINAGAASGDKGTVCANITGNNAFSAAGNGIRGRATSATMILPGYAGAANDTAALNAFVQANNPATTDTISFAALGTPVGTITGGQACTTPSTPAAALVEEDQAASPSQASAPQMKQQLVVPVAVQQELTPAPFVGQISAPVAPQRAATAAVTANPDNAPVVNVSGKQALNGKTARTGKQTIAPSGHDGTVHVSIGSLAPGDSVQITFSVTVNTAFPSGVTKVENQGTVTGTGISPVLTDDPDNLTGSTDKTATLVLAPPDISIKDASAGEPESGSTHMAFTVTLSHAYTQNVTVNYATANGGANPATGGAACGDPNVDYKTASDTLTFTPGQTVQTVSVEVCSDTDTGETDETFLVNLSTPTNGAISDGQAVGTIKPVNTPGTVLISELRTSGPQGLEDDFVELYNNTDADIAIGGWGLFKKGTTCADAPVLVATITANTNLPARGHYLLTGAQYSLTTTAASDQPFATPLGEDSNVGLFSTADALLLSSDNRLDAVGFGANTGNNCDLLRESTTLTPTSGAGSNSEHSFARKLATGTPKDTNNNASDFNLVSTTPATPVGDNTTPVLGAPGPEEDASPIQRNADIKASLIDPTVSSSAPPNRVRSSHGTNSTYAAYGTLSIQRRFKNTLNVPVTRLRFRVANLSTFNNRAPGQADLRVLSSTGEVINSAGVTVETVNGLTLEPPPQPNGGGLNSSLTVVLPGNGLSPGNSIDVQFLLGVQEPGNFAFFVNVEALVGPPEQNLVEATSATKTGTTSKQRNAAGGAEQKQP